VPHLLSHYLSRNVEDGNAWTGVRAMLRERHQAFLKVRAALRSAALLMRRARKAIGTATHYTRGTHSMMAGLCAAGQTQRRSTLAKKLRRMSIEAIALQHAEADEQVRRTHTTLLGRSGCRPLGTATQYHAAPPGWPRALARGALCVPLQGSFTHACGRAGGGN
jgi:hypothetical protein